MQPDNSLKCDEYDCLAVAKALYFIRDTYSYIYPKVPRRLSGCVDPDFDRIFDGQVEPVWIVARLVGGR